MECPECKTNMSRLDKGPGHVTMSGFRYFYWYCRTCKEKYEEELDDIFDGPSSFTKVD